MSSGFIRAAKDGNLPVIKRIIYLGWIYSRMVLSRFYNKSHFGIRKNIAEFVGIYNLEATDDDGYTALHHASINDKPDCVEILLKNGANINATNICGETALHNASYLSRPNCLWILCKMGANVNVTNKFDETPLHIASQCSSHRCMEVLLGAGADPSSALPSHRNIAVRLSYLLCRRN